MWLKKNRKKLYLSQHRGKAEIWRHYDCIGNSIKHFDLTSTVSIASFRYHLSSKSLFRSVCPKYDKRRSTLCPLTALWFCFSVRFSHFLFLGALEWGKSTTETHLSPSRIACHISHSLHYFLVKKPINYLNLDLSVSYATKCGKY